MLTHVYLLFFYVCNYYLLHQIYIVYGLNVKVNLEILKLAFVSLQLNWESISFYGIQHF